MVKYVQSVHHPEMQIHEQKVLFCFVLHFSKLFLLCTHLLIYIFK